MTELERFRGEMEGLIDWYQHELAAREEIKWMGLGKPGFMDTTEITKEVLGEFNKRVINIKVGNRTLKELIEEASHDRIREDSRRGS